MANIDKNFRVKNGLDVKGTINLAAIAESKSETAVDVFVYDTSKDTDGGAWRHRTQNTSWYNEAASSIRGSRKEFPAVAVIVPEASKVTIYDGDDPSLPMWMVFDALVTRNDHFLTYGTNGGGVSAVSARNGILTVGRSSTTTSNQSYNGITIVSFIADAAERIGQYSGTNEGAFSGGISTRNSATLGAATGKLLVENHVNDVAMTVLPDAPTDPATGIEVPTIAVATDGGVSVIRDDGTVVDITNSNASYTNADNVAVNEYGAFTISLGADNSHRFVYVFDDIPPADTVITYNNKTATGLAPVSFYTDTPNFNADFRPVSNTSSINNETKDLLGNARGTNLGLARFDVDTTSPTSSLHTFATSSYNTGWMNGDIKLAALANSATADRSVNNNPLTQYGTITAGPVATGADLVSYSGFSSSNYLEQPYNPDLDFGTGDFCVMGWVKTELATGDIIDRNDGTTSNALRVKLTSGIVPRFSVASTTITGSTSVGSNTWRFLTYVRASGVGYIYVDSVLDTSAAMAGSVGTGVPTVFGNRYDYSALFNGSLALWRISATAPTSDQIKKIYEDEKFLYQENAQATLYGTSDTVTALDHDEDTDLLHVGTSAGRSVFQGLRRVDNTTDAVGTAISVVDGLVVEE
jgi:hypothetical protein